MGDLACCHGASPKSVIDVMITLVVLQNEVD